ncbi:MAG: terminase small subunit, partial [Lachnospiraceae bacterium]|nr:terminase small subunit [Lachnospiraceae bacterium]
IKEGKFGTEVSSYDKVKALELIGKHLGMFSEKKDDKIKDEVHIIDDI